MAYRPSYPQESPYHFTRLTGKFLTYYVHRSIPVHPNDRTTTLNNERYVNRPDLLSLDLYGSSEIWWVIPVRNGLQDPVFDLQMGVELFIPDANYVWSLV